MSTSGSGPINPGVSILNLSSTYINGARLAYATTTTFTVGAGQVRDSSNNMDIIIGAATTGTASGVNASPANSAAVTVNIALLGAGGVDTGTIAANKLYSVFAIGDSRGFNTGSAVMSLAVPTTGPALPLGYDSWRYVGSVQINGSTHVTIFKQTGAQALRPMWYDSGTLDGTHVGLAIPSGATTASQTLATIGVLTTLVPQTALEVMVYAGLVANAAGDSLFLTPYGLTAAVAAFAAPAASTMKMVVRVPCAFNAGTPSIVEIDYATSSATATVSFTLPGYVDQL